MYTEFSPLIELGLTVATDSMMIQGKLTTRRTRLTDLLNDPNVDYLILNDPTFMELGSRRALAQGAVAQVRVSDVLFVHTTEKPESDGAMRMPKQPVEATLLLPPFTIKGTIFLPYESDLKIALAAYGDKFEPVTDARYWAYAVAETPCAVDLLVFNHARAHLTVAAGVQWQTEVADSGTESGSTGW